MTGANQLVIQQITVCWLNSPVLFDEFFGIMPYITCTLSTASAIRKSTPRLAAEYGSAAVRPDFLHALAGGRLVCLLEICLSGRA